MRYEANIGASPIAGFKQEHTKTIKPSEHVGCVAPSMPGDSAGSMRSMTLAGDRACPPHLSPRFLSCSVGPVSTLTIAGSVGAARNRHRNRIQQPGRGPGPVEHQAPVCTYLKLPPRAVSTSGCSGSPFFWFSGGLAFDIWWACVASVVGPGITKRAAALGFAAGGL